MNKPRGLRPRFSVRVRFAVLYGALFLLSGIGLTILTNLLAVSQTAPVVPGSSPVAAPVSLAEAEETIAQLRAQLVGLRADQSHQLLTGSLLALAVMAVVSTGLGLVVAHRVLRPLRTITAATRRISADNLHHRLAVTGPDDDVKELADTIDGLLERLDGSFAAQRRFVANAAHELRTPLATIRAAVDVAVAKPTPVPPPTLALASRVRTELDRVDRLLDGFLMLARAQHGGLSDREATSLGRLVSASLTARAADLANRRLSLDGGALDDAAWTIGSPTLLARMVDNVVDNAIAHNHPGGWIRVASTSDATTAGLVVETGGPVLEAPEIAGLTRPFQRRGADRTGSERGSGLGLSIVEAIAAAHGGRVELRGRPEGGLRVALLLPLAAAPAGVSA